MKKRSNRNRQTGRVNYFKGEILRLGKRVRSSGGREYRQHNGTMVRTY